jgi:GNAT superfamily N-acetyltransferase
MTVDMPRQVQIPQLRALWQQAFGDSEEFLDGFFATGFDHRRCRCITWNDRVVAALYWFDCLWEGRKLAYIYAVATDENFQGKGFCRNLMEDTHRHLQKLGYFGAVLVPGSEGLFGLYGKLGYKTFSPRLWQEVVAGGEPSAVRAITAQEYAEKRKAYLPEGAIVQEGATLKYLATFAWFFEAENCLFCGGGGEEQFLMQEFLGEREQLPGILAALEVKTARVPVPGFGTDSAMYYPLTYQEDLPVYFGLALS